MPAYIKDNSYGELVFDWAWADAYHRAGLPYYPKLVTAIPYTPATGPRLLVAPEKDYATCATLLTDAGIKHAEQLNMSSIHWLFTNNKDSAFLKNRGYAMRLGCQFHWRNRNYANFDDFLAHLTSSKRKKIKRERRYVTDQNVELEIRHGQDMTDELWEIYHNFYTSTFNKKSGMPTLQLDFFREIGETMPANVVIVFAKHACNYVASAFNMRDTATLYGRHWGCNQEFHSLHFEACYYQGLEYCIEHKLTVFEPGAQGEHKISRGFLPTETWSAHWIAQPEFSDAISQFVEREQVGMQHYIESLKDHTPYKGTPAL
jgi:predicted N-acyltransferase